MGRVESPASVEMPKRALPPIEDAADRDDEAIENTEIISMRSLPNDYASDLAFTEQWVKIILHRGREKFSPDKIDVGVNGKTLWVETGKEVFVQRKYLEVLARAQAQDIRTDVQQIEGDEAARTINRILRSSHSVHNFQILEDPDPRGPAWYAKVMRES